MEIVPIIIGLTQLVKKQEVIEAKFLPIVAMFIAVVIGAIQSYAPELYETSLQWIIWGLTAAGLYGVGGETIKKIKAKKS